MKKNAFMISAMKSGSGKTMITLGLINLLKKSGKGISVFKTGPDYIDTMYHMKIAGIHSTNLDSYFLEPDFKRGELKKLFYKNCKKEIAIIEGAMGLFDGIYGEGKRSSACTVSEELNIDVILVANIDELDKISEYLSRYSNKVKALIINKLPKFYDIDALKEKVSSLNLILLGYVYYNESYRIESRHLGLFEPQKDIFTIVNKVSDELYTSLNIEALKEFKTEIPIISNSSILSGKSKYRLAFAYDEAFSFTYEENMKVLEEFGFEIIKFSPIHDKEIPKNISVLWIPGGYPELYAKELSENVSMLESIKSTKNSAIIAECGGFMYLHDSFEDNNGNEYKGAELIRGKAFKTQNLVHFGYIEIEAKKDTILLKKHEKIRSHEFHYYDSTNNGDCTHAVKANKSKEWDCIYSDKYIFAGFPHLYLRGYEFMIKNLVDFLLRNKYV